MRLLDRIGLARGQALTLGTLMERLAAIHGDRTLVTEADGGFTATFAAAAAQVDRWAAGIAAQSEPGDRVVLATANGYEQFLLTLAASRAGRVPAPVNGQMSPVEIDHVVADSGASLVVRATADVDGFEPFGTAAAADPAEVAALFYTSGTTGRPKGAELTHRGLVGGMSMAALLPSGLRRDELVLGLPVAHIFGFTAVVGAACGGLPVYFLPRFNPVKALDAIESRRATIFVGVPAMYRMLIEAGAADRDLTSVRLWISGADAMPTELATRFKRFGATATLPLVGPVGEASFAEGYGMVETGGGVAVRLSPPLLPTGLGGSVGVPLPGNAFKVVGPDGAEVPVGGVGELLLSGPGVLKGYHGAPEATAAALTDDGWLRTGDLARRGVAGMVNFEGRMKDVIKRGGYSVYAVEVEQSLEEHDDVLEAAVVPVPDARDGEVPVAAVRLRGGVDLAALDLGGWAAARLSAYKVPVRFVAVDDLPRTGTNKVQRQQVATLVQAAAEAPAASTATAPAPKARPRRAPAPRPPAKKAPAKKAAVKEATLGQVAVTRAPAKRVTATKAAARKAPAKRAAVTEATLGQAAVTRAAAKRVTATKAAARKAPAKRAAVTEAALGQAAVTRAAAKRVTATKAAARKAPAKRAAVTEAALGQAAVTRAPVKRVTATKVTARKAPAKRAAVTEAALGQAAVTRAPVKRATATKTAARKAPAKRAAVEQAALGQAAVTRAPAKRVTATKVTAKRAPATAR